MTATATKFYDRAVHVAGSPRTRKVVFWLAGITAFIAIAGFLIAPPIIRHVLESRLSAELHRKTTVERVRVNPFALSLTVQGLAIAERNADQRVVGLDELYANMSGASLFRLAPVLEQIRVVKPYLRIVRNADKSYNFQDVIDDFLQKPGGATPRFSLNNIEVIDARVDFDDQPEKQEHHLTDIQVGIPFISSLPYAADITVHPALSGKFDGAPFSVSGQALLFADPRQATIDVDINALELARFLDYAPVDVNFKLVSGILDSRLRLSFAMLEKEPRTLTVAGTVRVSKLDLREPGGAPLLVLPSLAAEIESIDVLGLEAKVKSVHLEGVDVHVTRRKDSALNLMDLIRRGPPTGGAKPEWQGIAARHGIRYTIGEVTVDKGTVHVADQVPTPPAQIVLENVTLALQGLSNARDAKAKGRLSFKAADFNAFEWDGTAQIEPLTAEGKVALTGFRLGALDPYRDRLLNVEYPQGTLDLTSSFTASLQDGNLAAQLSGLQAAVKTLRVRLRGEGDDVARVASFEIKDAAADLGKRTLTVGEVKSRDASARIVRAADGRINLARAIPVPAGETAGAAKDIAPWSVTLKHIALDDFALDYEDLTAKTPIKSRITKLSLDAEDLSNAKGARGKVNIRAAMNQNGKLALSGTGRLDPLSATMRVEATAVDVVPLQPLVEDILNVALTSGAVSAKGTLNIELPRDAAIKADYKGELGVSDLNCVDKVTQGEFLKWKSLTIGGVDARLQPFQVAVDDIKLADFYARIILNADATLNLQHIIKERGTAGETVTSPRAKPAAAAEKTERQGPLGLPANVTIGNITVENGDVNFTDEFIKPNYSADMTGITGSVGKMTPDTPGAVDLHGRVQKTAPLVITGSINAASPDLFVDIKAGAKEIDLPPLTPYSVKYAGYGITDGKLSMDVRYHLENRKLEAENHLTLHQLTFGEKVESPTATKLPVLLAVSLLKDRNGVINLNLPVSGTLDDPQFSLGGVIASAIGNLLTRIITAPFAFIGSLFGGGKSGPSGEELSYIDFAPGSSAITPESAKKLETIAKALNDRPALKLEIVGRADPKGDEEGLRHAFVEDKVKAEKLKSLRTSSGGEASLDPVKVEPGEYEKYLTAAYKDAKFDKPRNAIGLAKSLPVPEMEQLMLENTQVTRDDLRQLAEERAKLARDWLVTNGKVAPDRVAPGAAKLGAEGIKDKGRPNRVEFALK